MCHDTGVWLGRRFIVAPPHQTALWFPLPRSRACPPQREMYSEVGHGAETLYRGVVLLHDRRTPARAVRRRRHRRIGRGGDGPRHGPFTRVRLRRDVDGRRLKVELANPSGSGGGRSGGGYRSGGGGGGNRGGGGGVGGLWQGGRPCRSQRSRLPRAPI